MRNWDSLAALGNYLGMADAGKLANGAAAGPEADRILASINSITMALAEKLPPGTAGDLQEALASTKDRKSVV